MVEEEMLNCGYEKKRRNRWIREDRVVRVVRSSEFGRWLRIRWREDWKNDYAIIYDYSSGGGPICVVPISALFDSEFVKERRKKISYANSGYWWSQLFPMNHELVRLVLSFQGRWDILKG